MLLQLDHRPFLLLVQEVRRSSLKLVGLCLTWEMDLRCHNLQSPCLTSLFSLHRRHSNSRQRQLAETRRADADHQGQRDNAERQNSGQRRSVPHRRSGRLGA